MSRSAVRSRLVVCEDYEAGPFTLAQAELVKREVERIGHCKHQHRVVCVECGSSCSLTDEPCCMEDAG